MKIKNLYFILIASAALLLSSCYVDWVTNTKYIYINDTPDDITIISSSPDYVNGEIVPDIEREFLVKPGEKIEIVFSRDGKDADYISPFRWYYGSLDHLDYLEVSNGRVMVTEIRSDNGELFNIENYSRSSSKSYKWIYTYVFSEQYFENGEMIE